VEGAKCECEHYYDKHKHPSIKDPETGCLQSECKCRAFVMKQYGIADFAAEGCEGCKSGCCGVHRVASREWFEAKWVARHE